jgi:hypothetical protein
MACEQEAAAKALATADRILAEIDVAIDQANLMISQAALSDAQEAEFYACMAWYYCDAGSGGSGGSSRMSSTYTQRINKGVDRQEAHVRLDRLHRERTEAMSVRNKAAKHLEALKAAKQP